ncbi:MAG TPA: diaminopimelate decarboxylase [Caulobacteraceae bacterium]
MNHFEVREGELWCEEVRLSQIAEEVGTPVYVYSTATLERHYRVFRDALWEYEALERPLVAYAVKANANVSVLATLARLGAGADTVSQGEIRRALAAGMPPERIVFSGVGKTGDEIAFALGAGVGRINVESEPELTLVEAIAAARGAPAPVAIRVNPDVEGGGHAKISTGASASKFGVSLAQAPVLYARAAASPALLAQGLACHIGSQITDLAPLKTAYLVMRGLVEKLRGEGMAIASLDLGGGLGVPYFQQTDPPTPGAFAAMAAATAGGLGLQLIFEPGRVIAANAGILLSRVIHINARPDGRKFAVLDAAMNDLLRPAIYDAFHDIRPVAARAGARTPYDVVGPICESGDTFARDRKLPPLARGDLLAFMTAGAYGAAMASEYNSRLLAPEVLVRRDAFAIVRPRPSYEEMLAKEVRAPWL